MLNKLFDYFERKITSSASADKIEQSEKDKNTIKESFPLSEFAPVAKAGHWVHVEKPIKFLEIVTKFLKSD